jgi:hypothetical protein
MRLERKGPREGVRRFLRNVQVARSDFGCVEAVGVWSVSWSFTRNRHGLMGIVKRGECVG